MDLLYSRYASPQEFMHLYIEQGRFGEFVTEIIELENRRRREEAEKENDQKLWGMYVHSAENESFIDWKKRVLKHADNKASGSDADMTEADMEKLINDLFPEG